MTVENVRRINRLPQLLTLVMICSLIWLGYPSALRRLTSLTAAAPRSAQRLAANSPQLAAVGAPAVLLINATQLVTPINGGTTTLTVRVRDAQGRATPGVVVHLQSTLGSVDPATITTDEAGTAVVTFTAGASAGQAQVVATIGDLTRSAVLQIFKPNDATANRLTLTVSADKLASGGQLQVNVLLRDGGGAPLAGELVSFFGALGEVTPTGALTDSNGQVSFTYRAGNLTGPAMITVLAGYATASTTIQVGDVANPGQPNVPNRLFLPLVNR